MQNKKLGGLIGYGTFVVPLYSFLLAITPRIMRV